MQIQPPENKDFFQTLYPKQDLEDLDRYMEDLWLDRKCTKPLKTTINEIGIWGMPCKESIEGLAKLIGNEPALEVMAGTGYLSYWLRRYGVNVEVTSIRLPLKMFTGMVAECAILSAETRQYKWLIISWPPYNEPDAFDVLREMQPGTKLIYIGEGMGGCTANDIFHEELTTGRWKGIKHSIPWFSFKNLWDKIYIYEKLSN